MRRERQIAAIERLAAVVASDQLEPALLETQLEVERYTSTERFDAERRVLFRSLPLIVGCDSDLPEPGAYFTHDDAGIPLLISRDENGTVRAMLNVCRHRGTRLCDVVLFV